MSEASPVDQLESGVGGLRVPEPRADRESLLLKAGFAVAAVGLVLIIVGYVGAAGTLNVGEQVPYLLSGGILGLALVAIGMTLVMRYSLARLFRFWLARLVHEHQAQTDRMLEALRFMEAERSGRSE